jgi:hypothetical protein
MATLEFIKILCILIAREFHHSLQQERTIITIRFSFILLSTD